MSQTSNLFRLQQIDSPIDSARARIHEIETALSNNAILSQAQEYVKSTEQALQATHKALRITEDAAQDQRVKINQTESVLYGGKVQNPKELQDIQNEIAALKRYLGVLEDRQLDAMMALEGAETEQKQAIIKLDENQARIAEEQAGLRGELTQLQKTVERLIIERQAASTAVNPIDLNLYEQLRLSRRGLAVAKVSSQACGACGALLTPALVQAAHSSHELIRCTSCGRILYVG
jgi:predicted  nucleic acid-binding Zn-ribbon protein